MDGHVINPWECPPGENTNHRLVHMKNLPPNCQWTEIEPLFQSYNIQLHHQFGKQALVQFSDPVAARAFIASYHGEINIKQYPVSISLSPLTHLIPISETTTRASASRVICIQVTRLRVYLGIHDIYDECSLFGTVEKIICFEKAESKFALVQMSTVTEAGYVLANLSNSPRHLPAFQMRIQYSINQDIIIKFNNSKSFDFTSINANSQFAALREASAGEAPFFEPEKCAEVPPSFDLWRPVYFDPSFSSVLSFSGFEDLRQICDHLRNLTCQYGPVLRAKRVKRSVFLHMKSGFYARIAWTFLQGCPFRGRKLQIEFTTHTTFTSNGEISKEYGDEPEDLELADYGVMCFPSPAVAVAGDVPIEELGARAKPVGRVLVFQSIAEAAEFIATTNNSVLHGKPVRLYFTLMP